MDLFVNNGSQNINNGSHGKEKQSHVSRQAFGELKNVIHNSVTPFKSVDLMNDLNKIDTEKKDVKKLKPSPAPPKGVSAVEITPKVDHASSRSNEFDESFVDCIDFNDFNGCGKSDQEIWSEMGALEDSFINKLLEGVKQTMDSNDDETQGEGDLVDLIDLYSNSLIPDLGAAEQEEEADENLYPQFKIPDLSISDDDLPF